MRVEGKGTSHLGLLPLRGLAKRTWRPLDAFRGFYGWSRGRIQALDVAVDAMMKRKTRGTVRKDMPGHHQVGTAPRLLRTFWYVLDCGWQRPRPRGRPVGRCCWSLWAEHPLRPSSTWLSDAGNANALLDMMDKPEYYGDDQQEHMLTALSRITYHMKRQKGETWREFFTRWEGAMRKVHHHHINLPSDYEGFLMINGLQLSEPDTRAMLNFTRGCIKPASIKEWLRKNETKLAASELGSERNKTNKVFYAEEVTENDFYQETADDSDKEIEILESYLTDLQPGEEIKNDEVLEEEDAAEILATIIKQKKTYKESMREKKERESCQEAMDSPVEGPKAEARDKVSWSQDSTRSPLRRSRDVPGATTAEWLDIGNVNVRCQPRVPAERWMTPTTWRPLRRQTKRCSWASWNFNQPKLTWATVR